MVPRRAGLEKFLHLEAAGDLGKLPFELRLVRDALVHFHLQVGLAVLRQQPALDSSRRAHGCEELPDQRLAGAGLLRIDAVVNIVRKRQRSIL